jgi:transposase InsO family protein
MKSVLKPLLSALCRMFRSRTELILENAALRQQLDVYQRQTPRPKLWRTERLFWIWLYRHWSRWKSALVIVKPETVLRWHREGYRRYWRYRSKVPPGRPRIPRKHIEFIRRISTDHPEWGEDRIALELKLKLGVVHSASTIRRYMVTTSPPSNSTWRKFLASHSDQIFALDFTVHPLWNYSARYVLIILALHNRRVVHVAVTESPSLDWVKQQIREATPWDERPRFLIHDNDGIFGQYRNRERGQPRCALDAWLQETMGIKGIPIPYRVPNAAAYIERFMGTLKRECFHHFIFVSEGHLLRTAKEFVRYYNQARPHQGIQGIPGHGPDCQLAPDGPLDESSTMIAEPVLGGLIHDYRLAA